MKTLVIALIALGFTAHHALGQETQILQRARKLANDNNARQGASEPSHAPAPTSAATQKPAAPSPAQIQQQNINKIKTDIASILTSAEVSQVKVQKLAADLTGASRGPKKASSASINKLANDIAISLAGKTLGSSEQLRLAQNLDAVVNSSSLSKLQTDAYTSDVQAILQKAGAKNETAASAVIDIKAVVSELHY